MILHEIKIGPDKLTVTDSEVTFHRTGGQDKVIPLADIASVHCQTAGWTAQGQFTILEGAVRCPHCRSVQVNSEKKGFGAGKAVAGAVMLGPLGLLGGLVGSNAVMTTCLECGHQWKAGSQTISMKFNMFNNSKFEEAKRIIETHIP